MARMTIKAESCSSLLIFIIWLYRILKSSGLSDNRKGSITKAHQLA